MDMKLLYDLLKEMRDDQKQLTEKVFEQAAVLQLIQHDVKQNTADLSEHMRRTLLNEESIVLLKGRVEVLEEPSKFRRALRNKWARLIVIVGGVIGFGASIAQLVGLSIIDLFRK